MTRVRTSSGVIARRLPDQRNTWVVSQRNVDLVRGWFTRWNRGERSFDEVDSHPDAEIVSRFRPEPYRGRESFEQWVAEIDEHFERWELVVEEWTDGGENVVVAVGHLHLHGHGSGIEFRPTNGVADRTG